MPHNNIVSADFELIIVKSKQTLWRKCVSLFSGSLLVFQSLAPGLAAIPQAFSPTAFAQEVTETPTETPATTPETTPASTPESTPTEQPTITATPTEEVTPTPSVEVTPEATPTEEVSPTPTGEVSPSPEPTTNEQPGNNDGPPPQNNGPPAEQGQILDGASTTATPTATPTVVPTEPEEGELQAVIIQNVEAESLNLDNVDPNNSASLSTDKADYAPTDTALITGKDFIPGETYTLTISSNDPPPTSTTVTITADTDGTFAYAYQLDGIYRPDYRVEAKNLAEETVAVVTFTDAATGTLYPNGQGTYDSWEGSENDIDETGSASCGDDDGDDNVSEGTTNNRESVLIDLSSIPNGSTITSIDVTVSYRDGDSNGSNGTFQTFTRLNGVNLDSGTNLIGSSSTCASSTQAINVADTLKSGATTLEVGVLKTATDDSEVWVGTIRAVVTYTEVPVVLSDLVVLKTNNVGGSVELGNNFIWTLTVSNIGDGSAVFSNNDDILQDNLPQNASYSNLTVTPITGVTGDIDCDINGDENLDCDADGTVTIAAGGSFSVSFTVTPNEAGTFVNPRSGESMMCRVDPDDEVSELIGGNNNCLDTVEVSTVPNPTLPQACGLDIAMIIDNSTSIDSGEMTLFKSALTGFVTALGGTPTQYSISRFATTASVVQSFTGNTATVNAAINGIPVGGGYTNWEDGLLKGESTYDPRTNPDLVIFASDGNPNTVFGGGGGFASESEAVGAAQVIANQIKSAGRRILAIGVGNDLNTANLQAISGPNLNTGNVLTSDVITTDFANLATQLNTFASQTCGSTVTVTKLVDTDGNPNTTGDQTPADDWIFNIGGQSGQETNAQGQTPAVTLVAGSGYSITETVQPGYSLMSASCSGATNNGASNGTNAVTGVEIDNNDIVACTFINTPIPTGSITIIKDAQPDNSQDFGFNTTGGLFPDETSSPDFSLDDDANPTLSNTRTFTGVAAGTYGVSEVATAGWTLASATCSDQSPASAISLQAGESVTCTFTNTLDTGSIKVNKLLDNDGDGSFETANPAAFTWNFASTGPYVMGTTQSGFTVGNFNLTENSPAGYHLVGWYNHNGQGSCANPDSTTLPASVAIATNQTTEITICNALDAGHLIVQKTTLPGGDQTTFNVTATGSGTILSGATGSVTDANDHDYLVTPGTYSVSEDAPAGWTIVSNTCTDVAVASGETETCVITNGKLPTITVNKIVNNQYNGQRTEGQFVLRLDGNQITDEVANTVAPNTYTVSEDAEAGYTGVIGGDCTVNGSVTVTYGDNKVCDITNSDQPGTLIVEKIVVDSDASPSAFTFQVNGGDATTFEADGQNDFMNLPAGVYTVTEPAVEGYSTTYDNCTEVVLSNGETETCTITNTRTNGRVVFSKIVVGGDASASAWTFTINGVTGTFQSGDAANIPTGTYTVTESGDVAGYSTTSVSGICSDLTQNNTATLTVTENGGTCTFTNTRDTGSVKVNKRTDNNGDGDYNDSGEGLNGTASNAFTWSLDGSGANVMGATVANVVTGTHSVDENTVSGYHFVGWFPTSSTQYTCANPQNTTLPVSVDVANGQTAEVTLCNARDTGTVRITKDAINNDSQNFTFNTTGGTLPGSFQLDDDSNGTLPNTRLFTVPTGQYSVTEAIVSGWTLTNLVCSDDNGLVNLANRQAVVNVSTGEQITCTFTNTELGSIEGVKYNDRDGDANHDLLEPRLNGWTIFIDANLNGVLDSGESTDTTSGSILIFFPRGEYEFNNLLPGSYSVCEQLQSGWYNSTPLCQTVNVSPGENEDDVDFGNHEALTIQAYKVVCDNESYLPNWGDNDAPTISSSTAQNFVDNSEGHCQLQQDWDFQYGLDGQVSKETGDFIGPAGGNWQTLGTTNASGYAQTTITDLAGADGLWVRENLQVDYVPFSYPPVGPTENDFSAELYCSNDGDHYDNFDQVENPQFGNTYYCVAFNALNNGDIDVTKYNDRNGNGQQDPGEEVLSGWTINLSGQQSQQTSANGNVFFENLSPGTYALSENMQEGWTQTGISCSNEVEEEGPSGSTGASGATGVTGPTGSSGATGPEGGSTCHWNEGADEWNAIALPITNPGHSEHEEDYVYGGPVDQNGNPDNQLGDAWCAQNVPQQTEVLIDNQQTFLGIPRVLAQEIDIRDEENPTHPVNVGSGEHITCKIGNQFVNPDLTITKTNDAAGDKAPGQTVGFTLTVTADDGDVNGVTVTDLPSQGFTYQPGSWTATSDVRGDLKASLVTTEPTYASPGDWNLGNMIDGETVTLTYVTNISNDQQAGLYHDLAWSAGTDVLANEVVANDTTGVFVGTEVNVVRSTDGSAGINVIRDEKNDGSVLGASTELPATGASVFWLELAGLIFAAGIGSMIWGVSMSKKSKKSKRRLHA